MVHHQAGSRVVIPFGNQHVLVVTPFRTK
jgi:hypothetical protein